MAIVFQILVVLVLIILTILFAFRIKKKKEFTHLPENYKELLTDYVKFYRELNEAEQGQFEKRVEEFLSSVKITGVNAVAGDLDIILIAAGAIIPVYAIPDWRYMNLHEVLLYPGAFNEEFDQQGTDRFIAGMVGSGAMQHVMILTKWQLRQGFINNSDAHNTAIHEFVHLIDKMDGTMDGVPEIILERKYADRWRNLMNATIQQMKTHGSDIDRYGASNPVEFFAVISEYFFEQPALLKSNHPELFEMLAKIYKTRIMYHL
ncbi:MAG: zinc-dependent peptidase [Chitinophagaceae bacterium]|nr:zinc-dependent peptidase [Chitinophagaceae bacterium]